jgi:hypothetical protein
VVRRELVLDPNHKQARDMGIRARSDLSREYGRYNAPQGGDAYRHLNDDAAAREVAEASYIFGDPDHAVRSLKELERMGIT